MSQFCEVTGHGFIGDGVLVNDDNGTGHRFMDCL